MRVLISGAVLDQGMGGVRRHNQELLPRLAKRCLAEGGELAVLTPRRGLAIELGPDARIIEAAIPSSPPVFRALIETKRIVSALRSAEERGQPYQVVHSAHLPAPRLPKSLARKVRRTHTVHDLRKLELESTSPVQRLLAEPALRHALSGAAAVITVSETVRTELLRRFALPRDRCVVVPNAGDHLVPLARRPKSNAPILHVGHLEPRKNLELLIQALALAPDLPPLLLAGAAKPGEAERLRSFADQRRVSERVRMLGAVTELELAGLYAEAACVAIPSRLEGFGIGVLEAQLAGVPLAISNASALPEVAGPLTPSFDPSSAEQCVLAIRNALDSSQDELKRAAEHARRFSWDDSAERLYTALSAAPAIET